MGDTIEFPFSPLGERRRTEMRTGLQCEIRKRCDQHTNKRLSVVIRVRNELRKFIRTEKLCMVSMDTQKPYPGLIACYIMNRIARVLKARYPRKHEYLLSPESIVTDFLNELARVGAELIWIPDKKEIRGTVSQLNIKVLRPEYT